MTREEQIIEAGIDYTMSVRPMCIGGLSFEDEIRKMNRNKAFEEGAKWSDRTMIAKAYEWLKQNAKDYVVTCYDEGELNDEDLLNDFCEAMQK